ncbi:MAG: hypothetical protein R3A10_18280 [Caldilineaceae bacterium]
MTPTARPTVANVPFEFTMLGDWIMSVTVTKADGSEAKTDIDLNVADAGVTVK